MNKKGFTLTELLVTIVIIAVISSLATYGILTVSNKIKANMLETKKELIVTGAELYGEDNRKIIEGKNYYCNINGVIQQKKCWVLTVKEIPDDYLITKEKCDGEPCFKNNVTGEDMKDDVIFLYIKDSKIYAEFWDGINPPIEVR